jgi:hypothetical protein
MQIVSWWYRTDPKDVELQLRLVLLNPAGVQVFEQLAGIRWPADVSVPARIFVNLEKFPLTMFGLHWFTVEHQKPTKNKTPRWVMVTKIPLSIDRIISATIGPEPLSGPTLSAPPVSS